MKKVVAAFVVGSSLLTGASVLAAPIEIQGEVSARYVQEKATETQSGMVYSVLIAAEYPLGKAWSAYGRLGAQRTNQQQLGADFNSEYYGDKQTVVAFDQFGLKFQDANFAYTFGRQAAAVGATALLYSRADTNIGKKGFVDGISIAGKSGSTSLRGLLAQEDNPGDRNNKLYALRGEYSFTDQWTGGITLGRYVQREGASTNHWGVDGTYRWDKQSLTAEYSQSNSNRDNKALAIVWQYEPDKKTTFAVTGFRVEANGDMGQQSDFSNNHRGIHYSLTRALSAKNALELIYKDEKSLADGSKARSLEVTWSAGF